MNELLKWGLIIGGGYFLLKQVGVDLLKPEGVAEPVEPTVPTGETTKGLMAQYALNMEGFTGVLTFDQWNWVYSQVRGKAGPALEDVDYRQPREYLLSIDEWWGYVTKAGLTGLGRTLLTDLRSGGPQWFEQAAKRAIH